jgi:hypothetical protein
MDCNQKWWWKLGWGKLCGAEKMFVFQGIISVYGMLDLRATDYMVQNFVKEICVFVAKCQIPKVKLLFWGLYFKNNLYLEWRITLL